MFKVKGKRETEKDIYNAAFSSNQHYKSALKVLSVYLDFVSIYIISI